MQSQKKSNKLNYISSEIKLIAIVFTVFAIILILLIYFQVDFVGSNWDHIEPYIAYATIGIAIALWVHNLVSSYRENLPKVLNIDFEYKDEICAKVINAPLVGEDDIRNWGQSIGQNQVNKETRLKFAGFSIQGPNRKDRKSIYHLTIFLDDPLVDGFKDKVCFSDEGKLQKEDGE